MEWLKQINKEINERAKEKIEQHDGLGKSMHRKLRFFDLFTIDPTGYICKDKGVDTIVQSVIAIMAIKKIKSLVPFKDGNIIDLSLHHQSDGETFFLLNIKEPVVKHELLNHPAFGE